jgi:hypothetical protein
MDGLPEQTIYFGSNRQFRSGFYFVNAAGGPSYDIGFGMERNTDSVVMVPLYNRDSLYEIQQPISTPPFEPTNPESEGQKLKVSNIVKQPLSEPSTSGLKGRGKDSSESSTSDLKGSGKETMATSDSDVEESSTSLEELDLIEEALKMPVKVGHLQLQNKRPAGASTVSVKKQKKTHKFTLIE